MTMEQVMAGIIVLILIAIAIFLLRRYVFGQSEKLVACVKNGGVCSEVCGRGEVVNPALGCGKENPLAVCCFDQERYTGVAGEGNCTKNGGVCAAGCGIGMTAKTGSAFGGCERLNPAFVCCVESVSDPANPLDPQAVTT
jgi:hypothetical protein